MFPIRNGGSTPLLPWKDQSTDSHTQVYRWAKQFPECNWGLDCEKSGLVVLDVDNKDGKNGTATLLELEEQNTFLPPTLAVCTPNKGKHFYFQGAARSRVAFAPGLDTRSSGGYVVLFGSTRPTGEYFIADDRPVARIPDWLAELVGQRALPRHTDPLSWTTEPDKVEYLEWAIEWLTSAAPHSISGNGGNDTLVKRVFFTLRDNGISETTATRLVLEHYNDTKAFPPWEEREIVLAAHNAYKYASLPPATETGELRTEMAARVFDPVAPTGVRVIKSFRGSDIRAVAVPPRRWILSHRLLRGYASGIVAPGGIGKSTYSFVQAISVVTGRDLLGEPVVEQGPVIIYNAEDPLDELKMRLTAVAQYYDVPIAKLNHIHLVSGQDEPLCIAKFDPRTQAYAPNDADIAALTELIRSTGAVVFIGDPLIDLHDVPENDNNEIKKVVRAFTGIATKMKIAVQLFHHTRKMGPNGGEGDAETSRGASSFTSALRFVHTLSVMDKKEAKRYNISEQDRSWYVRLDDAKLNMSPPADKVRWYKRVSVTIDNGESIGTLQLADLSARKPLPRGNTSDIEAIAGLCTPDEPLPFSVAVARLIDNNPDEPRTAVAISATLRRRFAETPTIRVGNKELTLFKGHKQLLFMATALDLTTALEREILG